jgi:pyruvoyl-dependent arginine decarboxylase (PvlArgDC)
MGSKPTRFWVTTGCGIDAEHYINSYDKALYDAGISEQNILGVSSVPPATKIEPIVRDGLTYVPMPEEASSRVSILSKGFKPLRLSGEKGEYLVLDSSWTIDVVLARSNGDQFQGITSSIGLGAYKTHDGHGVYAVEDHGNNSVEGSIDNCVEMLQKMLRMRNREPVNEDDQEPKVTVERNIPLTEAQSRLSGRKEKLYARKLIWQSWKPKIEVHTISIDPIPEGYVGTVIAAVVFDPFTEIHS